MGSLKKLKIVSFRGASQPLELAFDPNKPVILIFGENGTGKSTIIDALDFVLNGQPGSLDDRASISKRTICLASMHFLRI